MGHFGPNSSDFGALESPEPPEGPKWRPEGTLRGKGGNGASEGPGKLGENSGEIPKGFGIVFGSISSDFGAFLGFFLKPFPPPPPSELTGAGAAVSAPWRRGGTAHARPRPPPALIG